MPAGCRAGISKPCRPARADRHWRRPGAGPMVPAMNDLTLSDDQADAFDRLSDLFSSAGIDLIEAALAEVDRRVA